MLLVEMVSVSSKEFFEGIPDNRHRMMMDYYEMCSVVSANKERIVKAACLEVLRCKFFSSGFNQFDHKEVIDEFSHYCSKNKNQCRRMMESGFLEDLKEFVYKFVNGL